MKDVEKYINKLLGINRFTDPFEKYQKTFDSIGAIPAPYQKVIDALGVIPDPYKKTIDALGVIPDPYQKVIDALGVIPDPYQKVIDALSVIPDPYQKVIDAMGIMPDSYQRAINALDVKPETYQRAIDALGVIADPFENYQETIASLNPKAFQNFKNIALRTNDSIDIDKNGNVSLSSTQILASELQGLADESISKSIDKVTRSVEQSINNLIIEIRNQKDPLLQKLLIWFLYPIIVGIILAFVNPVAQQFVKSNNIGQAKKETSKEFKANVKSVVTDKELLKVMRYVSADYLNVRVTASVKADIIGQLKFSSVVVVIGKRQNWSLVQWKDTNSDISIKGWVFSRYLKKFK